MPSGDPPLGTGKVPGLFYVAVFNANLLSLPSGQWPDGTGGSPVPPMPASEFVFRRASFVPIFRPAVLAVGENFTRQFFHGGVHAGFAQVKLHEAQPLGSRAKFSGQLVE